MGHRSDFGGRGQQVAHRSARRAMAEQSIKAKIYPKDIAALAVFLASDAAKSISGQVLPIYNDRQWAARVADARLKVVRLDKRS
jgi:hypothetical protein